MRVDHVHAVKTRDHQKFVGGFALSGLLGVWENQHDSLGTLSLGTWVLAVDPSFITGHQRIMNSGSELINSTISLLS